VTRRGLVWFSFAAVLAVVADSLAGAHSVAAARSRYVSAVVNKQGNLRVAFEDGRRITVLPDTPGSGTHWKQRGFGDIQIAPDGRSVGWISQTSGCGPIGPRSDGSYCPGFPETLVVYENGRTHRYGDGIPIWKWTFLADGAQVGYERMMLHFSNEEYFELRDVATDRVLAKFTIKIDAVPAEVPDWVRAVDRDLPR